MVDEAVTAVVVEEGEVILSEDGPAMADGVIVEVAAQAMYVTIIYPIHSHL